MRTCKQDLENIDRILRQECHPITGSHAFAPQPGRHSADPIIKLFVGVAFARVVIDQRHRIGPQVGMESDPVVGRHRHGHHRTTLAAQVYPVPAPS